MSRDLSIAFLPRASAAAKPVIYRAAPDDARWAQMMGLLAERFPQALRLAGAVPHFYDDGMLLEVDVHAAAFRGPLISQGSVAGGTLLEHVAGSGLVWARLVPGEPAALEGALQLLAASGLRLVSLALLAI
jgi:hypothetical protein